VWHLHFSLISKKESRFITSPVCLSVCVSSINCMVNFHEIWYGGDVIQGDLDAIIFNPIASNILKWSRFKFHICCLAE
jgi:hypothetical protein